MGKDINCLYTKIFQNSKYQEKLSKYSFVFPSILFSLKNKLLFWKYTAVHSYKSRGINITSVGSKFNVTIKLYQSLHTCTNMRREFLVHKNCLALSLRFCLVLSPNILVYICLFVNHHQQSLWWNTSLCKRILIQFQKSTLHIISLGYN